MSRVCLSRVILFVRKSLNDVYLIFIYMSCSQAVGETRIATPSALGRRRSSLPGTWPSSQRPCIGIILSTVSHSKDAPFAISSFRNLIPGPPEWLQPQHCDFAKRTSEANLVLADSGLLQQGQVCSKQEDWIDNHRTTRK